MEIALTFNLVFSIWLKIMKKTLAFLTLSQLFVLPLLAQDCNKTCLEDIADQYRVAYLAHDPTAVAIAETVRFSENNVEMPFPDATWDTITEELGPPLTISDPVTGQAAIFTVIIQNDTPGFLAARLRVENREITEIEHIISTRRNLSSPPTPIGDHENYSHDAAIDVVIPASDRATREELMAHARGYFSTLERNDGEIRGTCFIEDAIRRENGLQFDQIKAGFESGRYFFNNEVRNWPILVDEERQVALSRGFIDHKGVLDEYTLTDGTETRSIFREPHTWAFLEMFAVRDGCIDSVVATFITTHYKHPTPWNPEGYHPQ